MNEHLKSVFEILLSALEKEKIHYWVYGGVSVAAYVGKFIRYNNDVDIFVKDTDFQKAKELLEVVCAEHNLSKLREVDSKHWRRKLEIKNRNGEGLSIVSIKQTNNSVLHMFGKKTKEYPVAILTIVKRNIDGFRFITLSNEYIKKLFVDYLKFRGTRPKQTTRRKILADARALFTDEELSSLTPIFNNAVWSEREDS